MGKTGEHRHLVTNDLQRFQTLGETKIRSTAMWKPRPILVSRIGTERHGYAIGHVETSEPFAIGGQFLRAGKIHKRLEPGQSQRNSRSTQKPSSIE